MPNKKSLLLLTLLITGILILPEVGLADVEGTLGNIRDTLINRLMPLFAVLGLCFSGFSFISGNPNAKNHMFMAIFGAIIGFGAPSIIAFAQGMVQ